MRRVSVFVASALLASCMRASTLAPQDVLQRSVEANRTMQSADFNVDMSFRLPVMQSMTQEGTLRAQGTVQNAGRQLQFTVDARGNPVLGGHKGEDWALAGSVIVAGENDVYLKIDHADSDGDTPLLPVAVLRQLIGQWLKLPADSSQGGDAIDLTPDPELLRLQTETVSVTHDRGIGVLDGRRMHHYDVTIDQAKLASFLKSTDKSSDNKIDKTIASLSALSISGELWIDANTYVLRRAQWLVKSNDQKSPLDVRLTLNMNNFNAAHAISPPADAHPFPSVETDTGSPQIIPLE